MNKSKSLSNPTQRRWAQIAGSELRGREVADVTYDSEGCPVLVLKDNSERTSRPRIVVAYIMCDDEGNGPGAMHLYTNTDDELMPHPDLPIIPTVRP